MDLKKETLAEWVPVNTEKVTKEMYKELENIVWHIEKNRTVLGDQRTLNSVDKSLRRILGDYEFLK